ILVLIPLIRLWRIIRSMIGHGISRDDRRTLIQVERDIALQVNRKTQIRSGWKPNGSSAGRGGSIDGLVDGSRIQSLSIALPPAGAYVIDACSGVLPVRDKNPCNQNTQDHGGPSHSYLLME